MKKILSALALSISALAFAADPPMTEPKKTEQQPMTNDPMMGRNDDLDAKTQIPHQEPVVQQAKNLEPSAKDRECLAKLHHDNEMEIQMGKLAKKNGQAKQVKAYGDMLIKDHSLADKQVVAVAKKHKIDLTMPAPKDEAEQADMQAKMDAMARLETLKGDEFDREFAKMMVEDHQKAVTMLEGTLTSTQDAKVRTLIEKVLPVIKEHLRVAEGINKKVQSV
jgi:predicted outer membrane protein